MGSPAAEVPRTPQGHSPYSLVLLLDHVVELHVVGHVAGELVQPECFFLLSNYLLQESLIFLFIIFFTEANCLPPPRGEIKDIGRRGPPAASGREAGRPPGIRAPAPGGGRRGLLPGSACHPAAGRAGYAAHELPPGPCGGLTLPTSHPSLQP